jgi:hypothetical protein
MFLRNIISVINIAVLLLCLFKKTKLLNSGLHAFEKKSLQHQTHFIFSWNHSTDPKRIPNNI